MVAERRSSSNGRTSSATATARCKSEVLKAIEGGRDVLLDIDWQGTQQLKQVDPDIVRVFILPPSMEELERRLRARGTDSDEVIQQPDGARRRRDQPLGRI